MMDASYVVEGVDWEFDLSRDVRGGFMAGDLEIGPWTAVLTIHRADITGQVDAGKPHSIPVSIPKGPK